MPTCHPRSTKTNKTLTTHAHTTAHARTRKHLLMNNCYMCLSSICGCRYCHGSIGFEQNMLPASGDSNIPLLIISLKRTNASRNRFSTGTFTRIWSAYRFSTNTHICAHTYYLRTLMQTSGQFEEHASV